MDYDGATCSVAYEAAWKPFGVEVPLCQPQCDHEEKYLGKDKPDSHGLYWFGARYYDPEIGRFTSLDPVLGALSVPQKLNRNAFAGNDPTCPITPGGSSPAGVSMASSTSRCALQL